jgi:hypothetical protein
MRGLLQMALLSAGVFVAVVCFLGALQWIAKRGRPAAGGRPGELVFRETWLFRWFAYILAFGGPTSILVIAWFHPPKGDMEVGGFVCILVGFTALSVPLLWMAVRFRLVLSEDGLDCTPVWRPRRFLAWEEVKEVTYSARMSTFVVRAWDGWTFSISILMPGVFTFLDQCELRLPAAALQGARDGYARLGRPFPEDAFNARLPEGYRDPAPRPTPRPASGPGGALGQHITEEQQVRDDRMQPE